MIETIYLARHGFRLSWETSVWNAPTGTPRDPPLAAHGVGQAKELAAHFAGMKEGERPNVVYSSPLYRCLETASPTAEALDLPLNGSSTLALVPHSLANEHQTQVEHGVSEWYLPVRSGLHPRALPSSALREWFPRIQTSPSDTSLIYPPQKGESMATVHDRAEEVLRRLIARLDEQEGMKVLVIFTHAATNIALARALMGDRDAAVQSGCCSLGKYLRKREGDVVGAWERVLNGDCSHLEKGEERHWEFSYVEEYEEDGVMPDGSEEGPLASERYQVPTRTTSGGSSGKL